jgi:hypothetical protein
MVFVIHNNTHILTEERALLTLHDLEQLGLTSRRLPDPHEDLLRDVLGFRSVPEHLGDGSDGNTIILNINYGDYVRDVSKSDHSIHGE